MVNGCYVASCANAAMITYSEDSFLTVIDIIGCKAYISIEFVVISNRDIFRVR